MVYPLSRRSTDKLWDAGERQLAASTEAFSKLNRPYVFVFGVKNIEPGPNDNFDALVPYFVANHGQSPALIERIEYRLHPSVTPEETGAALDDHPLVVSPVLGINEKITATAASVVWLDSGHRIVSMDAAELKERGSGASKVFAIPEIKIPGTAWYFRVKIFYRGPFSNNHETSGCWRYDRETCQFIQFGGTEYNYTK